MIFLNENELVHVDSYVDIIEHYGVKGMKWGVRRRANKLISKFNNAVVKDLRKKGYELPDDIMKDYSLGMAKIKSSNPNYSNSEIKALNKNADKRFKDFDRRWKSSEKKVKKSSSEYKDIDTIRDLRIKDVMAKHRYDLDRIDILSNSKAYRGSVKTFNNLVGYGTLATAAASGVDSNIGGYKNTAIVGGGVMAGTLATYGVARGIDAYKTRKIRKRMKQTRNEIKDKLRNYV